jgi:lipoprotein-anchoring transpeptidase ErfK/SrfK
LFVNLSDRQVHFYHGDVPIATYDIAIGRSGWETPVGEFRVVSMQVDPVWQNPFTGEIFHPGADNPLGSRWIGFWTNGEQQIGLHGTNQEDLIGQAVSHGCIRMREADVQALYEQVTLGTVVVVRP